MRSERIVGLTLFMMVLVVFLCGCATSSIQSPSSNSTAIQLGDYNQDDQKLTFNNSAWHYDAENNIYWQIGVFYCSKPETTDYENLAIYVPGDYFTAASNGDGTYTCTYNKTGTVNGYTTKTAPIVFPMNTAGYSAQAPATSYSYSGISNYTKSGFVYVYAGLRGRNNGYDSNGTLIYSGGAPWGVTDLKAAVRYYRFNQEILPGNTDRIFVFGMSGGGAQTAIMGASGDSTLYFPYLESIGAAMVDTSGSYISDAIFGAMCWCPITSLDYADEAYEWNMGQYASTGTRNNSTWTSSLSADLARAYGPYINGLQLKDENGTVLTLKETTGGIYTSGTYADYLLSVIEGSLNNFLHDTSFPYTKTQSSIRPDGGFGGGAPGTPPQGGMPMGGMPTGLPPGGDQPQSTDSNPITYNTVQDYINSLNSDGEWVKYDADTNTVKITSIKDFVNHCKNATKSVPAFDDVNRTQAENYVFGNDASDARHFDETVAELLEKNQAEYSGYSDWNSSLIDAYKTDMSSLDKFGNGIAYRQNMYNPMYYVCNYYDGYKNSTPAPYWRIRTGINQGDTALTVETNMALALRQYDRVKDVDFETVWGLGHTTAERTGDNTDNFINWVNTCVAKNNT